MAETVKVSSPPDFQAALRQLDEHIQFVKTDIQSLWHVPGMDILSLGEAMFHLGRVKGTIHRMLNDEIKEDDDGKKPD